MSTVRMLNSVGEHVAGQQYEFEDELADRFILLGYADGRLSRDYSVDERNELQAGHQEVSV